MYVRICTLTTPFHSSHAWFLGISPSRSSSSLAPKEKRNNIKNSGSRSSKAARKKVEGDTEITVRTERTETGMKHEVKGQAFWLQGGILERGSSVYQKRIPGGFKAIWSILRIVTLYGGCSGHLSHHISREYQVIMEVIFYLLLGKEVGFETHSTMYTVCLYVECSMDCISSQIYLLWTQ